VAKKRSVEKKGYGRIKKGQQSTKKKVKRRRRKRNLPRGKETCLKTKGGKGNIVSKIWAWAGWAQHIRS